MKYFWKRYSGYALSFGAIGIIALLIAACPAASGGNGGGGTPGGGNGNGGGSAPRYLCANGMPQSGTPDGTSDVIACTRCNAGYRLSNGLCNASCTERSGTYTLGDPSPQGNDILTLRMISVPVGTRLNFFTGEYDESDATIDSPYSIAETELTYAVYRRVRDWANARATNSYDLNLGRAGSGGSDGGAGDGSNDHPVTRISWFDSVKFANALSEYCALGPVYLNGATVMRSGTTDPTVSSSANGFRLPESNEWELAARYRNNANNDGDIKDSNEFYPGTFASGATSATNDPPATGAVAWYNANSGSRSRPVKGKSANALMLYDMSGNVAEWTFTLFSSLRMTRGGNWRTLDTFLLRTGLSQSQPPNLQDVTLGVRLAR